MGAGETAVAMRSSTAFHCRSGTSWAISSTDIRFACCPARVTDVEVSLDGVADHSADSLLYDRQIRSRIDEGPQQHVPRDPGGCIDPGMASAAHGAVICAAR